MPLPHFIVKIGKFGVPYNVTGFAMEYCESIFPKFCGFIDPTMTEGIVLCLYEKYEELFILIFHNISKKVYWPILYANLFAVYLQLSAVTLLQSVFNAHIVKYDQKFNMLQIRVPSKLHKHFII